MPPPPSLFIQRAITALQGLFLDLPLGARIYPMQNRHEAPAPDDSCRKWVFFSTNFFSPDYCQLPKTRIPKWQCWRSSWQIQSVRKQRAEEFVVTEVSGKRSDLASNVFTLWERHIYTPESTNKTLSEGDITPCVEEGRSTSCSRDVRETNGEDACRFWNSWKEFFFEFSGKRFLFF